MEDHDYDKAITQFRLQMGGLLHPLRRYGQQEYVDLVIPEIVNLAMQLHLRLSGIDTPIEAKEFHYTP